MPRKTRASAPATIQRSARDAQMLELRIAGATLAQIGQQMDLTPGGVLLAIQREMRANVAPLVEELRGLENERLDRLWMAIYPKAVQGDLRAIDRAVRISERRAKLNGLDVPVPDAHTMDLAAMMNAGAKVTVEPQPEAPAVSITYNDFREIAAAIREIVPAEELRDRTRRALAYEPEPDDWEGED